MLIIEIIKIFSCNIHLKAEHYGELQTNVKIIELGPKPEDENTNQHNYFQFWATKFPHLLIHTWRVVECEPRVSPNISKNFCIDL